MEISFIIKTTLELSREDVASILNMFHDVMSHDRTEEEFYNMFLNTPLGYSFHIMMYDGIEFVGFHTDIPSYLLIDGNRRLCVSGCDTMIKKGHRDFFNYMDMISFNTKEMKKKGVVLEYGYPNDLNYTILTKGKLSDTVGHMFVYCLPYRVGAYHHVLRPFDWLSEMFCYVWLYIVSMFASKKISRFRIEKDLESFNESRYKRNDGKYFIQDGFVYKIQVYKGIRTAFLIDVFEKSPYNFCKAVKYIVNKERHNFDILLYPGYLPFLITGMVKIPHKFEPKHFHMTARLFDRTLVEKNLIFDINNWDTNLSNYDLI